MSETSRGGTVLTRALLMAALATPAAAAGSLGVFDGHGDVGDVKHPGSVRYDAERQSYTVTGAGANMWFDRDAFHLAWKRMSGDFILRTRAAFVGEGVNPHRKLGWIVRASLDPDSAYADAAVHGDGLTSLQFRRAKGGDTEEIRSSVSGADVIQLAREGNVYTVSVASFGDLLVSERVELELGDEVYAGLFVCAHEEEVTETAVFRNVRIVVPAPDGFVPYRDYIGSNLELLEVATGDRTIVHRYSGSFQAPNWTPDGAALIYNQEGLLYRFDLARGEPSVIDTGFATRNNNDHVLSFDGTRLGISHHDESQGGRSLVYTLPATGGTPRRVTEKGPSYLHGWSPDGRYLVYTGERDGELDIYRIPVEGGEEVRLTATAGLDDGSEYSPDGEHIYFNSARTGSMEIWRMAPDGSRQEQLTGDAYNNWFPHVSPDGERVAFLSYPPEVDPGDHPFYEQVTLRLMPAAGGEPRVVAYLYGGQGTINVPSWAPDGRRLAFVSNTVVD